jgi:branched-chain amino acid transport system ATP-binding protein
VTTAAVLATSGLVAGYERDLPIVRGIDFAVHAGDLVVVLGPNGAGKSTFVKAIAGLVPIHAGSASLSGRDVTRVPAYEKIRHGLAFVPQTDNVFATLSIADNLRLAADILPKADRARRIAEIYQMFPDLADRSGRRAGALSGGQRQMLAIARALIVKPSVLILDEPSAGLSPRIVGEVFERLTAVKASGVAIILVEQNVKAALAVADRGVILVEGRLRHEGTASGLLADPLVAELYLGVRREPAVAGA